MRLLELQGQKGDGHLFIVEIPDWGQVPFKLPSINRSRQYNAALLLCDNEMDRYMLFEKIFRECVVDLDVAFDLEMPVGLVDSVARLVLSLSGVGENAVIYTEGLFETYRSQFHDPVVFMKRTICSVFSGYTFESLDKLDYQSLVEVFINAETMMMEAGILEQPYSFKQEEEKKPKKSLALPMGPAGMPGRSPRPIDDTPLTSSGSIDVDALVADGQKMKREDSAVPARGAHNLHDNPKYKTKKEAVFNKLNKKR